MKHLEAAGLKLDKLKLIPASRYYSFSPEKVDVMAGFILSTAQAKKVSETSDIKKDELAGGSYLKCTHQGPYDKLEVSWKAAMAEITRLGKSNGSEGGNCYELYVKDPSTCKPEEILTEIYIRVVAGEKRKRVEEPVKTEEERHKSVVSDVCHLDLAFLDKARTQKFYAGVFQWSFMDYTDDYFVFMTKSGGGGFTKKKDKSEVTKGSILPYIMVKDLSDDFKKLVVSLGGKLLGEVVPLKDTKDGHEFGSFLKIEDPEGNVIAAWKDTPKPQ
jgi:predicted enzyme related to lactoylglutathione lyase/effector-binding domain-containing protein